MSFATRSMLSNAAGAGGGGGGTKYTGTITCGFATSGFVDSYGFSAGAFGSRSPTTVSGHSFDGLYDVYAGGYATSPLVISGFGADPLTGFITSVTANGITLAPASYSYSAGTAQWNFTTAGGFNFPSSGIVDVTMVGS